jgi:hypothetical protein
MDEGEYEIFDSDYEYEYTPRTHSSRKTYLQEEIICLEKTLAKRRAELREADRLLNECDDDLVAVRKEVRFSSFVRSRVDFLFCFPYRLKRLSKSMKLPSLVSAAA